MFSFEVDGRLQVTAGTALLENSRLVEWLPNGRRFSPVSREIFEWSWRRDVDPAFGRVICWIGFSAGAEMLAKGVCLLHEVEIRSPQTVARYPQTDLAAWAKDYIKDWKSRGTLSGVNYGTLRHLVDQFNPRTKLPPALPRLCDKVSATQPQRELLLAAYGLLASTIRNRDTHAYVPKVRDHHFSLVPDLFSECFNVLTSWLPGGPATLNSWQRDASEFIASL